MNKIFVEMSLTHAGKRPGRILFNESLSKWASHMQAKDWDVFCSMTLVEILMSPILDSLPDSDSIRLRLASSLIIKSMITLIYQLSHS